MGGGGHLSLLQYLCLQVVGPCTQLLQHSLGLLENLGVCQGVLHKRAINSHQLLHTKP